MPEGHQQEEQFDLRGYVQIVLNRKWLILGFAAALTVAVGVGTAFQPKLYEARTTLLVGREGPRLLVSDPVPGERIGQKDYLQTQSAILTSRSLLKGAVEKLIKEGFYGEVAVAGREQRVVDLAKDIQYRTHVVTSEDSQVIVLNVVGGFPDRVARIANAVADEFVESNQESRVTMANQAVTWLTTKLAEQKSKLTLAEDELRAFKERENIVAADDADPFATLNLSRLNDEYLTTRFQRMERESRLATLKRSRDARSTQGGGSATGSLDAEIQRKVRESLEADYIKAQVDLRNLSEHYGPEHPDYITLKGKVAKIAKELENLEQPAASPDAAPVVTSSQIADVESELNVLNQKEQALSRALESQKAQAQNLSRTAVGYSLRKQAVDLNRQTYNDLLTRLNDAQLSSQIRTTVVRVLDPAEPPRSPVSPQPVRNLMVAMPLGLVLGLGLALLLETLDRRVKSPEEAARYLRLPILTVVPGIGLGKGVGREEGKATLVTIAEPRSHAAECYRNLRTSILFSTGRPVPKTILVTSAVGGEGKSTTAANLAVVLTQSGRKVLLIDADLRRPALHRYFPREKNRGIVRLLNESCPPEEATQTSMIANLDVLLCHRVPSNPSELLGSDRMIQVIEHFKQRYDVVVIDSPVIISIPDTLILASRAESVVLVHRPGAADRGMVKYARDKLDEVKANILGLVLNNVDLRTGGYHDPNYLYYGYGSEEEQEARGGRRSKKT